MAKTTIQKKAVKGSPREEYPIAPDITQGTNALIPMSVTMPKPLLADFLISEEANILNDYIAQYIGQAKQQSDPSSGVYRQQDKIVLLQTYNDLYGYEVYDEVERDAHFGSVLMTRKLAVSGLEWSITPFDDSDAAEKQAEQVEDDIRGILGFTQDIVELGDATLKGFSVAEIMWGNKGSRIIPLELKNRPQRRFQFDAATLEPKLRKIGNAWLGDPLSPYKFIIHRNSQKYDNPFGDALGQSLWWPFYFKKLFTKLWLQYQEVGASVIPMMTLPNNADQNLKNTAMAVLEKIRSSGYGYKTESMKLELLRLISSFRLQRGMKSVSGGAIQRLPSEF